MKAAICYIALDINVHVNIKVCGFLVKMSIYIKTVAYSSYVNALYRIVILSTSWIIIFVQLCHELSNRQKPPQLCYMECISIIYYCSTTWLINHPATKVDIEMIKEKEKADWGCQKGKEKEAKKLNYAFWNRIISCGYLISNKKSFYFLPQS